MAAWQWRDAERQRAMAVERLANSQAAAMFTSTVLIEGMQPGESLSFEQLIARSEEIARQTRAGRPAHPDLRHGFPRRLVSRQRPVSQRRSGADTHDRFVAGRVGRARRVVTLRARRVVEPARPLGRRAGDAHARTLGHHRRRCDRLAVPAGARRIRAQQRRRGRRARVRAARAASASRSPASTPSTAARTSCNTSAPPMDCATSSARRTRNIARRSRC